MGIALSAAGALHGLLAPCQALIGWLSSSWSRTASNQPGSRHAPVFIAQQPYSTGVSAGFSYHQWPDRPSHPSRPARATRTSRPPAAVALRPTRPLRVTRVREAGGASGGRLVISGRMADVCAELDRLAAAEVARLH